MVTLAHERITGAVQPKAWIFFVHGFLGSGTNWRTFARKLVAEKPLWGAVLVDIRMHGESQNCTPPHTVFSAAQDLVELAKTFDEPVRAVLGHSFGAKVVLKFVELAHEHLDTAWLVDFVPWSIVDRSSASITYKILGILEPLVEQRFSSRTVFENIVIDAGIDKSTAQWLSMNLVQNNEVYILRIQPAALRLLLDDYFALDLMHVFEKSSLMHTKIHFAVGGKSEVLTEVDKQRIFNLASKKNIEVHLFEHAGHYVHVHSPHELGAAVAQSLS